MIGKTRCPKCRLHPRTHVERDGVLVCTGRAMPTPGGGLMGLPGSNGAPWGPGTWRKLTREERIAALPPPVLRLAAQVAARHGIAREQLLAPPGPRTPRLVAARQELWAVTTDSWGLSTNEAGALFGVDHTSIMHAIRARAARAVFVAAGRAEAGPR